MRHCADRRNATVASSASRRTSAVQPSFSHRRSARDDGEPSQWFQVKLRPGEASGR